jgi:hypothetical protein
MKKHIRKYLLLQGQIEFVNSESMNRLFLTIALAAGFHFLLTGQIYLEHTYNHSGTFTHLKNSGNKFFIMDVGSNQCRIYNVNHSLWKTINLSVPFDNYLYDIRFVSENLFTLDNSLCLAYVYYKYDAVNQYYTFTAKVIRENGTVLLTIPGCQYLYVTSLADGETKLVTYSYDYSVTPGTIQTTVYNLPGELLSSQGTPELPSFHQRSAFPNPSKGYTNIPYAFPEGEETGEIIITDLQGRIVESYQVDKTFDHLIIDTGQFPRGMYLYFLKSGNYNSPAEKLQIN